MKLFFCATILFSSTFSTLMAKDVSPFEDAYIKKINEEYKEKAFTEQVKVTYLTKLLEHQQKSYDDKIAFLETELRKTKDRLIEKSMNQEKIEETIKDKYGSELLLLKKDLAYTTKTMLEYQRQIEKMKPNEDLKKIIKLNTELASELRKSEDQLAFFQLKQVEMARGERKAASGGRVPASVPSEK
jgi:hypothetical protein